MTYSSLVSYIKISPNKTSPRNHKIDTVSIHCMAGPLSVESCGNIFQDPKNQASSNYGIGADGRVALYVDENDRSWCTSSAANDNRAITIEVADKGDAAHTVDSNVYTTLINLLVDICKRNNIKQLLWKGDKSLIGQVEKQNMTVHRWFSNKSCPGDYLYNKHGEIANEVNSRLSSILGYLGGIVSDTLSKKSSIQYESNLGSKIIDYSNRLIAKDARDRNSAVNCITIHSAKQSGTLEELAVLLNSTQTSFNYGIDDKGRIGLFVDESMSTSSTTNSYNDNRTVNIVCTNSTLDPSYQITDYCYNSLVDLCEDICRRNSIGWLHYSGNSQTDSMTMHRQFNPASNCPGPYLASKINNICSTVNERLTKYSSYLYDVSSASVDEDYLQYLYEQGCISIQNTRPYVVRVDEGVVGINYSALKSIGVVGAMINAGKVYNAKHNKLVYRSETVYKQALEVNKANMPFGYYFTTHARTIVEVKEEAYWFYFVVSKYPPKLGVWLRCDFDLSKKSKTAKNLVQRWYEYFVEWGLKSKCGLYCTEEQAAMIGWPDQCTYMNMWLETGPNSDNCPPDEILIPSFFSGVR